MDHYQTRMVVLAVWKNLHVNKLVHSEVPYITFNKVCIALYLYGYISQ